MPYSFVTKLFSPVIVANANIRHCNDEKTTKLSLRHKYNHYYELLCFVDGFISRLLKYIYFRFAREEHQQMKFTLIKKVFVYLVPYRWIVNSRWGRFETVIVGLHRAFTGKQSQGASGLQHARTKHSLSRICSLRCVSPISPGIAKQWFIRIC